MLEYLKIYAQKAYREITSIINNPGFLFSNDPEAMGREASCNYYYIHGFTRLIKHNRITNDRIVEAFKLLEDNIEIYLRKHYRNKKFIYYLMQMHLSLHLLCLYCLITKNDNWLILWI